jgi:large subunit ribosomal protein L29
MKIKELRALSRDELISKEKALMLELFGANAQRYAGSVDKPHRFSLIRKDIARIKTILNDKKAK